MSRILFLDIDGVLNSERSCHAFGGYPHDFTPGGIARFDLVAVALVRRLCRESGAVVVLSSTWRYHFSAAEVAAALDLPVIGTTTIVNANDYASRGGEIAAWLAEHPEVEHYAIIDDIDVMLPEQQAHFVQTDWRCGLSLDDCQRLHMLLTDPDCAIREAA